jgi:acyl-CoA dehydrogenase
MVLHAAFKIDRGEDYRGEVSMAKHFVANALNRTYKRDRSTRTATGNLPL